ncbi:unnamed protein product [Ectocarpus sp. 8 AP-2014]
MPTKTSTTSTSSARMAPFVSTAAALLALLVLLCSTVMAAATQVAGTERRPPTYGPAAAVGGATPMRPGLLGQKVKVDVFLGLGCEKSARAWPILKRAASDQRNRVDFVFHILPVSDDPIVFSAAKAAQVLLAYAGETSSGVEDFVDLIFLGQEAIHDDQQVMDLTVDEARDIIGDWPLSFSSIPADVFHSAMRDPLFDPIVLGDLGNNFTAAVSGTPTVVLNGNFIMLLCGDRGLRDFQMFLEHFQIEDSGSGIRGGGGSAVFGLDDTWGSAWPMWQEMDQEIGDAYQDMLAEQQQQQEKLREKEEAGEGCGTVREGLPSPTSSRSSPSWLSSSFENLASSWSTSHEAIPPTVTKDQSEGAGVGDGGWDVESTTTSSSSSAGHADIPPSKSLSPWSSVSESWSPYEASLFEALDERAALSEEAAAAAAAAWRATGGGSRLEEEGEEEGEEEEEEQGRSFGGEVSSVFTGSHDAGSEGGGGGGGDGSPPEDVFAWFEAEEKLGAVTEGPGSAGAGEIPEDVATKGSVSKAEAADAAAAAGVMEADAGISEEDPVAFFASEDTWILDQSEAVERREKNFETRVGETGFGAQEAIETRELRQ